MKKSIISGPNTHGIGQKSFHHHMVASYNPYCILFYAGRALR